MNERDADSEVRDELNRVENMINSPKVRDLKNRVRETHGYVRPRDASTMILIDGGANNFRILMGKRNKDLKFMPGALVFPGGRVDPGDGYVKTADDLAAPTKAKLISNMRGRASEHRARALGLAAIRETAEESGLLIGSAGQVGTKSEDWHQFRDANIAPSLSPLRLMSRAITPPGMARRFDTWFFVAHASAIGFTPNGGFAPSGELEGLQWIKPEDAIASDTREITRVMLVELMNRLKRDPKLDPDYPAPYYFARNSKFQKEAM